MNGEYLHKLSPEEFFEYAKPALSETIKRDIDLKKVSAMVQSRVEIISDIPDIIDFFEEVPEYDSEMYVHKKMKTTKESSLSLLREVLPLLKEIDDYSNDNLYSKLSDFAKEKEYKNGYVFWPLRTAVSGKQSTPGGATELMEILGKEESVKRIENAIDKLSA